MHRVLEHIGAGDVFQVNVTQRLTADWTADVHALYRALRHRSPAPHGAVVERGGIASISPETFLLAEGRDVTIRPIKGTRPRSADPDEDARAAEELRRSEKDRAENVMVVDMERNDLGRVCRPGTVEVPELLSVEAHPTVWHAERSGSSRPAPPTPRWRSAPRSSATVALTTGRAVASWPTPIRTEHAESLDKAAAFLAATGAVAPSPQAAGAAR